MRTFKNNSNETGQPEKDPSFDRSMMEKHRIDLGLGVPENYFSESRNNILSLTSEKKGNDRLIRLRKAVIWTVAAGIALILTLTVFNPETAEKAAGIGTKISDTLEQIRTNPSGIERQFTEYDRVLIASLFLDETEIDGYAADHFLQEIIIDEYIDIYFMEHGTDDELIFD